MKKAEAVVQNEIRLAVGGLPTVTLFRQNVGKLWTGRGRIKGPGHVTLGPRDIVLRDARPIDAGLCKGSSDLIGWRTVEITPDMVGQKVAVFAAIEVKGHGGRATAQQQNFVEQVRASGGLAVIARTVDEALGGIGETL